MANLDVAVRVGADLKPLKRGMKDAGMTVGMFETKTVRAMRNSAASIAKVGAAAAAAGAAILAGLWRSGSAAIDAQAKLAHQLNTTSESMATLTRAGDLAGITSEKLAASGRALTISLGKAAEGAGAQSDTLNRLGLSASELASIPLDKRILAINDAIKNNIPAVERAAVAADLFGSKNAAALLTLDPATIARAREEVEVFGLAISDVDAAKIELANDSISRFKMASQGAAQQMSIAMAPALEAVGNLFFEAAKEAGGFGTVAFKVMDKVVTAAGFVANAMHGIKVIIKGLEAAFYGFAVVVNRIFQGVNLAIGGVIDFASGNINELLKQINKIPGVDIDLINVSGFTRVSSQFAHQAELMQQAMRDTATEAHNMAMQEMPLDKLRRYIDAAQAATQAAAEASVAGRSSSAGGAEDDPEAEAMRDQLQKRLDALRESLKSEAQLKSEKYTAEADLLKQSLDNSLITEEAYNALIQEAAQRHVDEMLRISSDGAAKDEAIDEATKASKLSLASAMMNNLANLMNTGSKKMFNIGKMAAIASAVVDGHAAAVSSYKAGAKIGGPLMGAAFAATSVAATGSMIQKIRSQSFGGGSGGGTTSFSGGVPVQNVQQVGGQQQQQSKANVSISLVGDTFSAESVRKLIGQIGEQLGDGVILRGA
jgi:hypothetical protein